jgi:hypothetical protein
MIQTDGHRKADLMVFYAGRSEVRICNLKGAHINSNTRVLPSYLDPNSL